MGSVKTPPLDLFADSLDDAERLLRLSRTLLNARSDGVSDRARTALAHALGIPGPPELKCLDSHELFIVLKPGAKDAAEEFTAPQLRALLRQSVVAIATSVETYVAAKAATFVDETLNGPTLPPRLAKFLAEANVSLDQARTWRTARLVKDHVYRTTTASPAQIGIVFSLVGKPKVMTTADCYRAAKKGQTEEELEALAKRRNDIVHRGDRAPEARRRRSLKPRDVDEYLRTAREDVFALDAVLGTPRQTSPRRESGPP
jgi:hypothetical protein